MFQDTGKVPEVFWTELCLESYRNPKSEQLTRSEVLVNNMLIVPGFSLTTVTVNGAHFPRPLDVLSPDEDKDEDVDSGEEGHRHEPRDHQPRPVDVVVDVPRV